MHPALMIVCVITLHMCIHTLHAYVFYRELLLALDAGVHFRYDWIDLLMNHLA